MKFSRHVIPFPPALALTHLLSISQDLNAQPTPTPTPTPNPTTVQLQQLKEQTDLQKAISDNQKAISDAQLAVAKSKVGTFDATGLPTGSGKVDDKVSIEGSILAYKTANEVARQIAGQVAAAGSAGGCPSGIAFYGQREFADLWGVNGLKQQLERSIAEGTKLKGGGAGPSFAVPVVLAAIQVAVALSSLAKQDVEIHGIAVTGDDQALHAALTGELRRLCPATIIVEPSVYYAPVLSGEKDLAKLLDKLGTLASDLSVIAADPKTPKEKQTAMGGFADATKKLMDALSKADDNGMTLLQRLLRAESLAAKATDHVLVLRFVSVGGNYILKKNLLGTKILFSGGVVISYSMQDGSGKIETAGVIPLYGKLVAEKDLNRLLPAPTPTPQKAK